MLANIIGNVLVVNTTDSQALVVVNQFDIKNRVFLKDDL